MGFFNDIGKKTTQTTNKIAKETKLKMKISENKGKISDIYQEIGKKIYEKHVREENIVIKEEILEECSKLDELCKEIEEAKKEILRLNKKRMCPKCYAEINIEDQFCPKCGEKQTEEKTILEIAEEKLEETEIKPEKEEEAEIVKEKLEEKNDNKE